METVLSGQLICPQSHRLRWLPVWLCHGGGSVHRVSPTVFLSLLGDVSLGTSPVQCCVSPLQCYTGVTQSPSSVDSVSSSLLLCTKPVVTTPSLAFSVAVPFEERHTVRLLWSVAFSPGHPHVETDSWLLCALFWVYSSAPFTIRQRYSEGLIPRLFFGFCLCFFNELCLRSTSMVPV